MSVVIKNPAKNIAGQMYNWNGEHSRLHAFFYSDFTAGPGISPDPASREDLARGLYHRSGMGTRESACRHPAPKVRIELNVV